MAGLNGNSDPSVLQDSSWQDRAFIGIKKKGGSAVKYFAGLTNELELPDISQDFSAEPVMNGGMVRENDAQDSLEITLTIYPIGVLTGDGTTRPEGVGEWFLTDEITADTTYGPSLKREDFGIAVLWTNVTDSENTVSPVQADSEISTTGSVKAAKRHVYKNAQITEFNQDFGDQVHTAEVTFKLAPYDETGQGNYEHQSSTDTTTTSLSTVLDSY